MISKSKMSDVEKYATYFQGHIDNWTIFRTSTRCPSLDVPMISTYVQRFPIYPICMCIYIIIHVCYLRLDRSETSKSENIYI